MPVKSCIFMEKPCRSNQWGAEIFGRAAACIYTFSGVSQIFSELRNIKGKLSCLAVAVKKMLDDYTFYRSC